MKKKFLLLLLCIASTIQAEDSLLTLEQLQKSKKDQELFNELAQREEIAKTLHYLLFSDTGSMLKDLGNDEFLKRERATLNLIRSGDKGKKEVEALMKATKDPEVKSRCERILKNLKSGTQNDDSIMNSAVSLILSSNDNSDETFDFLKYYYKNFRNLPNNLKQKLPLALKKSEGRKALAPLLTDMIIKEADDSIYSVLQEGLAKIDPDGFKKEKLKINAWRELEKIDLYKKAEEFNSSRSHDGMTFINLRQKIRRIDGWYLIKKECVRKLFRENDAFLVAAAAFLIGEEDPKPYLDDVLYVLKENQKRERKISLTYFSWGLMGIHIKPEFFGDHVELFLDSGDYSMYDYALRCIADPEKYRDRLIKDMFDNSLALDYLIKTFPDEKDKLIKLILKRVFQDKNDDSFSLYSIGRMLEKCDYKSDDLKKWFLGKLKTNPEYFKGISITALRQFNINPDLYMDKLDTFAPNTSNISSKDIPYLLSCRNRQLTSIWILNKFAKSPASYNLSMVKPMMKYAPSQLNQMLKTTLEYLAEKPDSFNAYYIEKSAPDYAEAIEKRTELIKTIRNCLDNGKPFSQIYSAIILTHTKNHKQEGIDALVKLIPEIKKQTATLLPVIKILLNSPETPEKAVAELAAPFLEACWEKWSKWDKWGYHRVLRNFNKQHPSSAPVLWKKMKEIQGIPMNFYFATAEAVVNSDPNFEPAVKELNETITKPGNIDDAFSSLRILKNNGYKIKLKDEILDFNQVNERNSERIFLAISCSEENIPGSRPYLKKYIENDVPSPISLKSHMEENDSIKKFLLPLLFEHLEHKKNSKNTVEILKYFKNEIIKHLGSLKETYAKLTKREEIDNYSYLISFAGKDASSFTELTQNLYKDNLDSPCYLFCMAKIHTDVNVRKEMAQKFVDYADNDKLLLKNNNIFSDADSISEFPDIVNTFLGKKVNSKNVDIKRIAMETIASQEMKNFQVQELGKLIKLYSKGEEEKLFWHIMHFLRRNKHPVKKLYPYFEELPEEKKTERFHRLYLRMIEKHKEIEDGVSE